jgi:hypothetical protein
MLMKEQLTLYTAYPLAKAERNPNNALLPPMERQRVEIRLKKTLKRA